MQDDGLDEPIKLYFWTTPNGYKIAIMLEELGTPYRTQFVNITKGEQFAPEFLAVSPNNRIPAIVDPDGWVVVDYKTDVVSRSRPLDSLVAHYLPQVRTYAAAWARCTGQPVKEVGLFFTSAGAYRAVPLA